MLILHSLHNCPVNGPPKFDNFRIGLSPSVNQRRKLLFGEAHVQSAHRLKGTDTAAVAEGQFSDFALLTKVAIDAVFFYRHSKHLTGRSTINITALGEDLLPPAFACKPRNDTGFNGRKVGYIKACAFSWNKGSTNELRECIRDIFV